MKADLSIFYELGFNPTKDFESKSLVFDRNEELTTRLEKLVFFYKSPNNTNTSFYIIATIISQDEIEDIRRYVWNKNDADLIFYYPSAGAKLVMFYAKYSPRVGYRESILDTFSTTQLDAEKIDKIKQWQFDSGVFWFNYSRFINKAKYKGIDKELVTTLESLKKQLDSALTNLIQNESIRNENVQALIDRTLYIKYLEDNHIINSHFYEHYFDDDALNYEKLLISDTGNDLNKLFEKIHEIFNNSLFERPTIENEYLTSEVRTLIANSFDTNLNTGQLKLFHFQFDILPVEFISYIYEVFLSEKQKKNGIYYTPKKLAQLIIDEVINQDKIGSILDPSSGSGMFLIIGYQRLLEIARKQGLEPNSSLEKIKFRTRLLSENIFGIEKELTAQRFTLFSLSLQIFNGINPNDIKTYIAEQLRLNKKIDLFSEYSFFNNIKRANSLDLEANHFNGRTFSYLVGNPPFFEIPNTTEYRKEMSFLNSYKFKVSNKKTLNAKEIVGKYQISQCFFLKIKDWANQNTRFGFVSNSSNFYNDKSKKFQNFFYSNYGIEKIYELSRVKKILFENANESVVTLIFTNNCFEAIINYYPVKLGLFSEKPFELLIIQEDKSIQISQSDVLENKTRLRDYLVGNEYDIDLVKKIHANSIELSEFALRNKKGKEEIHSGFKIWAEDARRKEYDLDSKSWIQLSRQERKKLRDNFYKKYFKIEKSDNHNKLYIEYKKLSKYRIEGISSYLSDISTFDRPRDNIYDGVKILLSRFGGVTAVLSEGEVYFNTDILTLKLRDNSLVHLVLAILNSHLITYFIDVFIKKRLDGKFSKLGVDDIRKIPIPKNIDPILFKKISAISEGISDGKLKYSEKKNQLNQLIYDLYELTFWERQRVEDSLLPKERTGSKRTALNNYKAVLNDILGFYLKNPITFDESLSSLNLKVIKISLNYNSNKPKSEKVRKYILNEIFEQNPNENLLASQEKIYSKNCVYIIKEDINKNWTETKAYEDSQDLLKHIILSYRNGERVH